MDQESRRKLPLPLIIICLIILFFCGLIYSAYYFQNKLSELRLNSMEEDAVSSGVQKRIVFAVVDAGERDDYLAELSSAVAGEIGVPGNIVTEKKDQALADLDNNRVDAVVMLNFDVEQDFEKYNYSDDFINRDQVFVTRAIDDRLQSQIDFGLSSLLSKGKVADIKQRFF